MPSRMFPKLQGFSLRLQPGNFINTQALGHLASSPSIGGLRLNSPAGLSGSSAKPCIAQSYGLPVFLLPPLQRNVTTRIRAATIDGSRNQVSPRRGIHAGRGCVSPTCRRRRLVGCHRRPALKGLGKLPSWCLGRAPPCGARGPWFASLGRADQGPQAVLGLKGSSSLQGSFNTL